MARCEVRGNDGDKAFELRLGVATHTFDRFECAINAGTPETRDRV